MLSKEFLEKLAIKKQIGLENVMREYVQNLFLSRFYTLKGSEKILFKGGTALKLVFGSPRYSEDLDFTGLKDNRLYERLLEETMVWLADSGVTLNLVESKPTSGGHLSILRIGVLGRKLEVKGEVSFREIGVSADREAVVINPEYIPPYSAYILSSPDLVREKVEALLMRGKPRDFFDLYFILRSPTLRQQMQLGEKQRATIFEMIKKQDRGMLRQDLQDLLPRSFWPTISDLPSALERELRRG